jgi:cobalt/nickel transport system permease protein
VPPRGPELENLSNADVPGWLVARERYEPRADRGRYLEKSVLSILGVLAALRERPGSGKVHEGVRPELKLASAFLLILLVSLSREPLFLEAAAAFELACLSLLRGEIIARALRKVLVAGLFAVAILLPALALGRGSNLPQLVAKVLLAVLAAAVFSATTPWPSIALAFSRLRVPDVLVMTLDMTIKYISLLGGLVLDMLYALKLRSVGRDERKASSLAGLAGTLFLKSKDAAVTQYQAMECRCFAGTYRVTGRTGFGWRDAAFLAVNLALAVAFIAFGS